jgi:integrase
VPRSGQDGRVQLACFCITGVHGNVLHADSRREQRAGAAISEELSALRRTCQGRSFADRRDAAILAVFEATGIRLSELAGTRYDPGDPEPQ